MKLTNYYRGMATCFDCVIHGTIYMTKNEWSDVYNWFSRVRKPFMYYDDGSFRKNIFFDDVKKMIETKRGWVLNIRVTPTEHLVKRYNLKNYKRGNYQIFIYK